MKFYLFYHTMDKSVYGATAEPSAAKLPPIPGGKWMPHAEIHETGKPRIGFSEAVAKKEIEAEGYHLFSPTQVRRVSTKPA